MRERPVRIEKIAVLRAAARPAGLGPSGAARPSARAGALAVGSTDTWGLMLRGAPAASSQRSRAPASGGAATLRRRLMANIHSQKKRILRAERERLENRRYTSTIKTFFRRLEAAVAAGDADTAQTEHLSLVRTIDKAVKRGALHRNTGARKKSRAARLLRGDDAA
jgi:small subunit ribosomal protein S20